MIHFPPAFIRAGRWLLRAIDAFFLGFPFWVIAALVVAVMIGTVAAFLRFWRIWG